MNGKIKINLILMIIAFSGMLLSSCNQSKQDSRAIDLAKGHSDENTISIDQKNKEQQSFVANLPIKIDSSSNYIVFQINVQSDEERKTKTEYSGRTAYNYNYLRNLIFQNIQTEEINILTTDNIEILNYQQLYKAKDITKNVILYQVIDTFSEDKDDLILTSLYLSFDSGKGFKKITLNNHHLTEWEYFPELKKIFYKTIEDSDGNNKHNNLDKYHIYSVSVEDFEARELLKTEFKELNYAG